MCSFEFVFQGLQPSPAVSTQESFSKEGIASGFFISIFTWSPLFPSTSASLALLGTHTNSIPSVFKLIWKVAKFPLKFCALFPRACLWSPTFRICFLQESLNFSLCASLKRAVVGTKRNCESEWNLHFYPEIDNLPHSRPLLVEPPPLSIHQHKTGRAPGPILKPPLGAPLRGWKASADKYSGPQSIPVQNVHLLVAGATGL